MKDQNSKRHRSTRDKLLLYNLLRAYRLLSKGNCELWNHLQVLTLHALGTQNRTKLRLIDAQLRRCEGEEKVKNVTWFLTTGLAEPKAKTIIEKHGFKDVDRQNRKHDEI